MKSSATATNFSLFRFVGLPTPAQPRCVDREIANRTSAVKFGIVLMTPEREAGFPMDAADIARAFA
jgi:hypothetical protein